MNDIYSLKLIGEIQSLKMTIKIQADALNNSSRKLKDANERIVEFERIKKEHLEYVKDLQAQTKHNQEIANQAYEANLELHKEIKRLKFELKYANDPEGM